MCIILALAPSENELNGHVNKVKLTPADVSNDECVQWKRFNYNSLFFFFNFEPLASKSNDDFTCLFHLMISSDDFTWRQLINYSPGRTHRTLNQAHGLCLVHVGAHEWHSVTADPWQPLLDNFYWTTFIGQRLLDNLQSFADTHSPSTSLCLIIDVFITPLIGDLQVWQSARPDLVFLNW